MEIARGHFIPYTLGGELASTDSRGDFFVYFPDFYENNGNEDDEVAMAKPAGHPDQIVIGTTWNLLTVCKAFDLLDSLGYGDCRNFSVIINHAVNKFDYRYKNRVPEQIRILTAISKIPNKVSGTNYPSFYNRVCAYTKIREPVFISFSLEDEYTISLRLGAIMFAGLVIHEQDHCHQFHQSLPDKSLWAERSAMTKEAKFLFEILNSGRLNKQEEGKIIFRLKDLSSTISDYRNGIGFSKHLTVPAEYSDGSPLRPQKLHNEDFAFGY